MLISFERYHESSLKQFWLMSTQNSDSSLIFIEDKLTWQIDDLISILINKLVTAVLETGRQYSCCIRETDSEMKCLIQVLSLQATTQSKIRLTADDFVSYRKILNSFSQKTVFLNIFISQKIMLLSIFISESIMYSSLNSSEKNTAILSLIKNVQEFNLQCRWISSQLCEKLKENLSFVLHENEILKKTNCVYISHQEMIWNQLLELYYDCSSENHWDRDKTLQLIQCHFIWNEILNDIHKYVVICSVCQSKAIHHHQSYN